MPYLMRYRALEPAYIALRQQGIRDTAQLLRLLALGRSCGIADWMSPERAGHFEDWRAGRSTFDDLAEQLAATRHRSAS